MTVERDPMSGLSFQSTQGWTNRAEVAPVARRSWRLKGWLIGGLLVVLLIIATGVMTGLYASQVYWPKTASGSLVTVTVPPSSSVADIATLLKNKQLINDPTIFGLYLRLSGQSAKLQAGTFQLPQHLSIQELVQRLEQAHRDEATLRFVEGWRREEMVAYIDQQHQDGAIEMTGQQFSDLALNPTPDLASRVGISLTNGDSLQGFLFPDTYVINKDETAKALIEKMLANFQQRVTSDITAGFKAQGLSTYQGLTFASIVERESHTGDERPIIAGILLKRLSIGMPLGADATIQYALGYSETEQKWWRATLTVDDLAISSPYNTRVNAGLPPHPICNPSLSAMEAVAHPTQTNFLYYLHDSQGVAHYAATLEQHNANVAKYLR